MFTRILFPTDGSALSRRAAKVAIQVAKKHGARLTALHVITPYVPVVFPDGMYVPADILSPEVYEKAAAKEAGKMLSAVETLAHAAHVKLDKTTVVSDRPWEAIVSAARKNKCDLVVMASHGRKGFEGLLIGSETTRVLTHSKVPVLVCR
jgi:nucleotide-binding universal stress UspA family protein